MTIKEVLPKRKVVIEIHFVTKDGKTALETLTSEAGEKIEALKIRRVLSKSDDAKKYLDLEYLAVIPLHAKYIFYVEEA